MVTITRARNHDLHEVLVLLMKVHLPVEGVADQFHNFLVARENANLVGCAGLEVYGNVGLIRSVAVDPSSQSQGLGRSLVTKIEKLASEKGLEEVYLLTETATTFFSKLNYVVIPRESANPKVRLSMEFTSLCPTSGRCMKKIVSQIEAL